MGANKKIPFNNWSLQRIYEGRKTCTSRKKKYVDDERVVYITPKMPWRIIKNYMWQAEGANSPEELQEVIELIHGRHVPDYEQFFVHFGDFSDEKGMHGESIAGDVWKAAKKENKLPEDLKNKIINEGG